MQYTTANNVRAYAGYNGRQKHINQQQQQQHQSNSAPSTLVSRHSQK